jgi:ribonuclease BN (tRNA processing enzyme)
MRHTMGAAVGQSRARSRGVRPAGDLGAAGDAGIVPGLVVRFWGVRGSHSVVTTGGSRIGVNTPCLELRWRDRIIILDAGSGIIPLGERLTREWKQSGATSQLAVSVLFTHGHHDHICGLPFFAPLYMPEAQVHLFGPDLAGMRFAEIVSSYLRSPYFPVDFADLPSQRSLRSISGGARLIWLPDAPDPQMRRTADEVPTDALSVDVLRGEAHPRNGTLIYRVSASGRSLVYATDLEMNVPESDFEQRLACFAQGADVLIHDAQYVQADYDGPQPHQGYGHSTPAMACRIAAAAHVRELVLFHTDPGYGDAAIAALEAEAGHTFAAARVAREGMEIWLDGAGTRHV